PVKAVGTSPTTRSSGSTAQRNASNGPPAANCSKTAPASGASAASRSGAIRLIRIPRCRRGTSGRGRRLARVAQPFARSIDAADRPCSAVIDGLRLAGEQPTQALDARIEGFEGVAHRLERHNHALVALLLLDVLATLLDALALLLAAQLLVL